jgi:hypothetical protein
MGLPVIPDATTKWQSPRPLALIFALFISYIISIAIYRLYFHPLAKYPGPFWAKLTSFPSWWHTKKQHRHLWLLSLQEKHGQRLPLHSKDRLSHLQVLNTGTNLTPYASTPPLHTDTFTVYGVTRGRATRTSCGGILLMR